MTFLFFYYFLLLLYCIYLYARCSNYRSAINGVKIRLGERRKRHKSVLWSDHILFKKVDMTGSLRTHFLDDILLNPLPRRRLLQLHPGPSWRSFSWRGRGVRRHMETSGRSQCASGCPGEQRRRGCSPPACAHCRERWGEFRLLKLCITFFLSYSVY